MNPIINNSIYLEKNHLISNDKKDIIIDLSIKDPFEFVPSIPIDAKSVFNKNEDFINQVKNQSFLVFLDEFNEYYNKSGSKSTEKEMVEWLLKKMLKNIRLKILYLLI